MVDPRRLSDEVEVFSAHDHAGMGWVAARQANEIAPIEGQQRAVFCNHEGEYAR